MSRDGRAVARIHARAGDYPAKSGTSTPREARPVRRRRGRGTKVSSGGVAVGGRVDHVGHALLIGIGLIAIGGWRCLVTSVLVAHSGLLFPVIPTSFIRAPQELNQSLTPVTLSLSSSSICFRQVLRQGALKQQFDRPAPSVCKVMKTPSFSANMDSLLDNAGYAGPGTVLAMFRGVSTHGTTSEKRRKGRIHTD